MTSKGTFENIRTQHRGCCITKSYQERGCKVDVPGVHKTSMVAIHGSKYQEKHRIGGKLCDRLIFGQIDKAFICSIELKGGKALKVNDAIQQIQAGLELADQLLSDRSEWNWYPLLVYSGRMHSAGLKLLHRKNVSFRGRKRTVQRVDCGLKLLDYLSKP